MANIQIGTYPAAGRSVVIILLVLSLAIFEYVKSFFNFNELFLQWWSDGWWTFFSLLAAYLCYEARYNQPAHISLAWACFAAGCLAWGMGMLVWDYLQLVEGEQVPFPSISDLGFLALAPFFMAGFIFYQLKSPTLSLLIKHISDLGLILCAILISFLVVIADLLAKLDVPWLYLYTALAYPPVYLGALLLGLVYMLLYVRGANLLPMLLVVGGLACHTFVDSLYAYALLDQTYKVGNYIDIYWLAGFSFISWGAVEQRNVVMMSENAISGAQSVTDGTSNLLSNRKTLALEAWIAAGSLILVGLVAFIYWDNLYLVHPYMLLPFAGGALVFLVLKEWASFRTENQWFAAVLNSEERVNMLMNSMVEAVYGADLDGKFTFANHAFLKMLGYESLEEIAGKDVHETIHMKQSSNGMDLSHKCELCSTRNHAATTHVDAGYLARKDGSVLAVELWSQPMSKHGKTIGTVVNFMDITQRLMTDRQMYQLSRALEQSADAVMITSHDGRIEYVNAGFESITGYKRDEVVGKKPSVLKSGKMDASFYKELWNDIKSDKIFFDVFVNRRKDGTLYYEQKTITPLKDSAGEITHYISTGVDITERMQHQERMQYLVQHDILTSLPNRILFMELLESAISRARSHGDKVAVLTIDLDRFKIINDTLGHDHGDMLLLSVVSRIKSCLDEGRVLARLGGDEFGIIVDPIAAAEDMPVIVKSIQEIMEKPYTVSGREVYITASIGISVFPDDGGDAQALLKNADAAMYRAKEQGRNTYQFYANEMSVNAFEKLNMESSLRRALQRQEFMLAYQPQVSLAHGRVTGLEALLRWRHPELGMVSPAQFVPLLEESGLIVPVGQWVLQEACTQMKKWEAENYGPLRLAVNLSVVQFTQSDLVDTVASVLNATSLSPDRLELEITESILAKNQDRTQSMLETLNEMGVSISIDDFGTGYSSLSYLKRFPISTLKIDRSFIRDVTTDMDDAAIVEAIVAMAHALDLEIIAEGVETYQQLSFIRKLQCHGLQGYLFSPPVLAAQVGEIIAKRLSFEQELKKPFHN